jgi:hypothetical protein
MNLTDLTELLRERSAAPPQHAGRLAAVETKVKARQRQRATAAIAAVVVVILGVAYATIAPGTRSSEPAGDPLHGFAEYSFGVRVIAATSGALPSRSAVLRFTPSSPDLKFFARCDVGHNRSIQLSLAAADKPMWIGGCGNDDRTMTFGDENASTWAQLGVVAGRPVELRVIIDGEQNPDDPGGPLLPTPESGTFAFAVGHPVPFSEYRFPPRPAELDDLSRDALVQQAILRADPADPNRAAEKTMTWPGPQEITLIANTPGTLRVLINDVEAAACTIWEYRGRCVKAADHWPAKSGLRLQAGQQVTIKVIPDRQSGDWAVALHDGP